MLRPHLDALASPRRRVVYYDQRREPVDHRRHVADVDEVRSSLGRDRIDLLGFSWGALLAILYALEHPQAVSRLVLVSPLPVHGGAADEIRARVAVASARPAVRAFAEKDAFARRVGPFLYTPERALELTAVDTDEAVARAAWSSLEGYDLRERLPQLRELPTLVVHGEDDPIPASTARETAALASARLEIIERCGHAPFFEAPGIFVPMVTRFLDAV